MMGGEHDYRRLAAHVMRSLVKGSILRVGLHQYVCASVLDRGQYDELRIKRDDGCCASFRRYAHEVIAFEELKRRKKQYSAVNLLRDIEGQLIVDVLNLNNPYHQTSQIYQMAKEYLVKELCNEPPLRV